MTRPIPTPHDPAALRHVAETVAAESAEFVRARREEVFGATPLADAVRTKSTPTDPVTVVDTETEALLRDRLAQLRPGDAVLGEEGGGPAARPAPGAVSWVLDPIDGTVNFVYGIPAYAVSVAAQVDGVSVAGAVADVARSEIYSAAVGSGAQVSGPDGTRVLRCAPTTELGMALVGTGFGYSVSRRTAQARLLAGLLPAVRDVRRIGSAALDLCLVAAGRLDAHYEHGLNVWDWAAGALIAAEAGARVLLPDPGQPAGLVMVSAPGIADQLTAALERLGGLAPLPE
ncbi:inositol monophosphatase family protein [Mycolicibacterium confluentis]|uniref:Inositol-1-monophosphatase n=1 Tax=Mycolicibacterium confluentis TaxID=28047 RepID=A0A7I7XXU8_9MYCO|nr:inositol monophosphatase family protein [Mycolicibacterium confluentis]MCV7317793.1 inositol monophosphatase [Mycolicibacterium confluentis]ORV28150.1 inositol monophosphatase [Mycolicibacterium confluentis]BBZ34160.1 inositol-1-monophosphatase SuhB [Mycolicibacterium confluentis]